MVNNSQSSKNGQNVSDRHIAGELWTSLVSQWARVWKNKKLNNLNFILKSMELVLLPHRSTHHCVLLSWGGAWVTAVLLGLPISLHADHFQPSCSDTTYPVPIIHQVITPSPHWLTRWTYYIFCGWSCKILHPTSHSLQYLPRISFFFLSLLPSENSSLIKISSSK